MKHLQKRVAEIMATDPNRSYQAATVDAMRECACLNCRMATR